MALCKLPIETLLDLDRYPLDNLNLDAAGAVVTQAHESLERDGACVFPGFLTDEGISDPCQSVNISVIDEGGQQPWHFDSGRFTVTLLLQAPHRGGDFEYVPRLRDVGNENYEGVAEVLAGARDQVQVAELAPGSLFVFLGEHSMHRVTPVIGTKRRLIALYLYDPAPGRWSVRSSNIRSYGPDAEAAMDAVGMQESATPGD